MGQALLGLDVQELQQLLSDQPRFRARQIYEALYRNRIFDPRGMTSLPGALRDRLAAEHPAGIPEVASRYDSTDGTKRYLLRLEDGKTVETVLMPEEDRDTLCISSQVGCPVNCGFCLTALMGLERNLTAGEIAGQVLRVCADNGLAPGESRIGIVMMGMGEPLLNVPNVLKAMRLLADPAGFGLSPRRVTVSTSGIIPRMIEFSQAPDDYRPKLAISLNASTQEQRERLMPITRKYRLDELMDTCRAYPLRPWERLTFEYVLLAGVNDSDRDARRVVSLVSNIKCKVNLIALNPGPGIPFETPGAERVSAFQDMVKRAVPCFIRKPRGLDIYAACGQLKRMTADRALVTL